MPFCAFYEGGNEILPIFSPNIAECIYPMREFWRIKLHHPWGTLYKKEIIEREQLRFIEEFSYMEDAIFNFQYYTYLKSFCAICEPLYFYRVLPNSLSHNRYIPNYVEILKTFYGGRLNLAKHFYIDDKLFYSNLYLDYFVSYHEAFKNNMRKDAPGNWFQKISLNSSLLKSDEFAEVYLYRNECLQRFTKRYIRALELAYHTGSYFWLWLLGVPGKIKEAIRRRS